MLLRKGKAFWWLLSWSAMWEAVLKSAHYLQSLFGFRAKLWAVAWLVAFKMGVCPAVLPKQSEDNRSRCLLSLGTGQGEGKGMGIPHECNFVHTRILFTSPPEKMELLFQRSWKVKLRTPSFVLRGLGQFGGYNERAATESGIVIFCNVLLCKAQKSRNCLPQMLHENAAGALYWFDL